MTVPVPCPHQNPSTAHDLPVFFRGLAPPILVVRYSDRSVCVCVCLQAIYLSNEMTCDLEIWHGCST